MKRTQFTNKFNECKVFANFELICWLTAAKDTVAMSTFLRVIVKMRQCSGRVYLEVNRQNFQELVDLKYFLNYNECNNHYLSHMTHVVSIFKPRIGFNLYAYLLEMIQFDSHMFQLD